MERKKEIRKLLLVAVLLLALLPGAWAVTRLDKVNGAGTGTNLTTSGNFTVDIYTDVAGANVSLSGNTSSGVFKVFCRNSTLGGASNVYNTTCDFRSSNINEGNLTLKVLANYTDAAGQANSTTFEVHIDYTAPVTNASSITLEGGERTRPGANRTISLIATDTNYTVANCTLYINPEAPNGVQMTRDSALADNFSYSFTPTWAGQAETWAQCYDSHTRNTGLTTRKAFVVAGGATGGVYGSVPAPQAAPLTVAAGSVAIGSRTVPTRTLAGLALLAVGGYLYLGAKKKSGGGKRKR